MLRIGLHRSSGLVSRLIKWQTRSDYSHASLVLEDDSILESMQGKGVVMNRKLHEAGERIDLFTVHALASVHQDALQFAKDQLGKGYDYTMVARFISRRGANRSASGKWFCSELVFAAFKESGLPLLRDTESWEVSPELLSKSPYLVPAGYKAAGKKAA
jgi:uncharacterized protein YycO